jgi:putative nucleotidyltransferase with HDIG domain
MMVASQAVLLHQIQSLPPLPAVVHRTLSVADSSRASVEDVARVLSEDQAIAARILRIANSSFYGAERRITQVSRAVVMLGRTGIRSLVLGIAARDAFRTPTAQVPEHGTLWKHAFATAASAELIARHVGYKPIEEAFVAGLLHDVGQLAMVAFAPDSFRAVFRDQGHGARFLARERAQFGVDHTQAGFQILSRWGLPEPICQVALRHHEPQIDLHAPSARLSALVMLADTVAYLMGFGFDMPAGTLARAETAARFLEFGDTEQMRISGALNRRIDEVVEMFANVDVAPHQRESATAKRAVWVSHEDSAFDIRQLVLEHRGYELRRVSPDGPGNDLSPDDLVILALSDQAAATAGAAELLRQGHRRIARLASSQLASPDRIGEQGALAPCASFESADGVTRGLTPPARQSAEMSGVAPAEDVTVGMSPRQRDPETGVCVIPWLFTAYDIQWVEEQFRA